VGTFKPKPKKKPEPNRIVGFFVFRFQLRFSSLGKPIYFLDFGFPSRTNRTTEYTELAGQQRIQPS
jgi:hypothetical protein